MTLNAKLVVVAGETKTTEIKLKLPSTIGRGRGTSILLPHPLVSRKHCELYEAEGRLMVRDLGSLNGTFVNNQKITESAVEPGELLTIGTVTFRAVYEPGDASPPGSSAGGKAAASDKTVREDKTVRGPAPSAKGKPAKPQPAKSNPAKSEPAKTKAAQAPATDDSAPLDFDFDEQLMPAGADEMNVTQQLEKPAVKKPGPAAKKESDGAAKGKPAAKPESDEGIEGSASDEDLKDFLKDLGE